MRKHTKPRRDTKQKFENLTPNFMHAELTQCIPGSHPVWCAQASSHKVGDPRMQAAERGLPRVARVEQNGRPLPQQHLAGAGDLHSVRALPARPPQPGQPGYKLPKHSPIKMLQVRRVKEIMCGRGPTSGTHMWPSWGRGGFSSQLVIKEPKP